MRTRQLVLSGLMIALVVIVGMGCTKSGHYTDQRAEKKISFLRNAHWDEKNKAEYQLYNYNLPWYKGPRKSDRSMVVIVKEPWDMKTMVKTSPKKMDSAVLKFSTFDQFVTGTYPYSFKQDIYFDTFNGQVVKYTMGSQDGCGNNFMEYINHGKTGSFTWHSYWNGHGTIRINRSTSEFDTFFDALPVYMRFRWKDKSYKVRAIQPLRANRPIDIKTKGHLADQKDTEKRGVPHIINVQVTKGEAEDIGGRKAVKFEVKHGKATDYYWLEEEFPHTMVKMEAKGGKVSKTLRKSEFFDYWVPANRGKSEENFLK